MKKAQLIKTINSLITDNDLDFDPAAKDATVADLNDLLADVEDAVAEAAGPPVVKVADLARELGKDPKTVRARLRRMYKSDDAADLPQPIQVGKWVYREEDRDALTELISTE